ncbi:streptophobe family protein [Streptomyces sp. NPDC057413]|uniref:streptophobe family protein n=1 Tax=Streptomyces sp. NPDC057413 TaxID=3346124 RepID=UPI0036C9120E
MSSAADAGRAGSTVHGAQVPWIDVLLSSIAAVSWALAGMAGTAALGLHLLGADSASALGPMTAAAVALGAGGAVRPSGDVSAFGLTGVEARTAIEITPLGVGLVGALLLSWFFLRSLRAAGVVVAPTELLTRVGTVLALFTGLMGVTAWAGHDVVTIDGGALGLQRLPGGSGGGGGAGAGAGGLEVPGLGDIGGLLPDRVGGLIDAKAKVGFTVETAPTLLGGLCWAAGVLLIALLASRRTPLPHGWGALHRMVRPAASALVGALLLAVAAGLAAAAYAAVGDGHPRRIVGAALLGAPNGVWLGVPLGLFVPWDGRASGVLTQVLPHPLDDLPGSGTDRPVTLARLADLDGRVWLLAVAAALLMLLAGVLTGVRTPVRGAGAGAFAGRCATGLAAVTAPALVLVGWLAGLSADASLSVLGIDAFGAGVSLHERLGTALLLGAVWGAGAGAAGGLLAYASGAAGRRAVTWGGADGRASGEAVGAEAPGRRPPPEGEAGGREQDGTWTRTQAAPTYPQAPGTYAPRERAGRETPAESSGPYRPSASYRPPNPDTNPYLRVPGDAPRPGDAPGSDREGPGRDWEGPGRDREGPSPDRERPSRDPEGPDTDVYGAPTVVGPLGPAGSPPRGRRGRRPPSWPDEVPPPPPPPPAPPPRSPKGPR